MYAGDFETGETEARGVLEKAPDYDLVWLPIAMKAVVDGDFEAARNAYESMEASRARGAPGAQVGLGDLASYTGNFEAAQKHLERAAELATADDNQYLAATAYMGMAFAHEAEGDLDAALEASARALEIESGEPWVVQAALLHVAAGNLEAAAAIAADLTNKLQPQTRAYGTLIEGLIAHSNGRIVDAIEKLSAALELADFWLIRFYLGRVYLDAGYFAEAVDELSQCIERQGEAASLFLDDIPTYRYVAPVYYWLGLAESQLGMGKSAKEKLQQFIELRPNGGAFVEDARKRL